MHKAIKVKRVKKVKFRKHKIYIHKLNNRNRSNKGVKANMNAIVSTETLFKTHKDYSSLNKEEKQQYLHQLTEEFMDSAYDLLDSLKDK